LVGVVDTEGTEDLQTPGSSVLSLQKSLEVAASAALFCKGSALAQFKFDEKLGLGTKIGSAEDLDLVLDMLSRGLKGIHSLEVRIGHPKKNRSMEYFPGSVAVLRKYSRHWPSAWILIIRRLVHGLLFMFQGKLKPKTLATAITAVLKKP
jgi:hypothetical protein